MFRFECVLNRPGLRGILSEKYVAVFSNFEDVLEEVQNLYETQKVHTWFLMIGFCHFMCPSILSIVIYLLY